MRIAINSVVDLRIRLLAPMDPHVFNQRALGFESCTTHFTFKLAYWVMNFGVFLQLSTASKSLRTDGTLVLVRKVD